nr:hypothetical protein [Tanacetum cinerariifolium]
MPSTMTTRSAGRPAAASRGGGTGGRAGSGGRTGGRSGDQGNGRDEGLCGQVGGQAQVSDQGRGQGNSRNQNGDAVNDKIQGDVSRGCTYKEFLACNPKEYDGMVTATEPKTIQKAVQISDTLTDEALRNGTIKKNLEKRGNVEEPSKDRNEREDNKRTRTRNAFATTAKLKEVTRPKKDFQKREDKDIDKQIALENQNSITHDINFLVHDMLIPLAYKTLKNVGIFENALKEEMLEDLKYVQFVDKEIDDLKMEIDALKSQLEHEKTDFLKVDNHLLQEFFSKYFFVCTILSLDDIDEYYDMSCKYLEKTKECEHLKNKLSKRQKQNHDKSFTQLEKHCINLELALQNKKEKSVCENS